MKDQTFNGKEHAEEIFFKSALGVEETFENIKNRFPNPYDYIDCSNERYLLKFTKRRLFFCEYNLHCDIAQYDNKYQLKLYYTIDNVKWTYWLFGILYAVLVSSTKILAKGDETINMLIFFGLLALILWGTYNNVYANPAQELLDNCKKIKKELEAYIKLVLEP